MYFFKQKQLKDIDFEKIYINRKGKYYHKFCCDNIFSFDIETTSAFVKDGKPCIFDYSKEPKYYEDKEKVALTYAWNFCIDGEYVFTGRTIEDYQYFLDDLISEIGNETFIFIYVHNLSFEFQNILIDTYNNDFDSVFARKTRHPISVKKDFIEYRCSYLLTGLSLDVCAKEYKCKHSKLVGDLNYNSKIRTPKSMLTIVEENYINNDVYIVCEVLEHFKKEYKHIYNIPLTQTGEVRRYLKKHMAKNTRWLNTCQAINMALDYNDFIFQHLAFMGGSTHANYIHAGNLINEKIICYDFTSSYPFNMLVNKYPVTRFVDCNYEDLKAFDFEYVYFIKVKYAGLKCIKYNEYLSLHKCYETKNVQLDNGKIISADSLITHITNIDEEIIEKCYTYEKKEILKCQYAVADYLPKEYLECILHLYKSKTKLKGIEGEEIVYLKYKQKLNSLYGQAVTNYFDDVINYNSTDSWDNITKFDKTVFEETKEKIYKTRFNCVNTYAIGVFVTSYSRQALWNIICDCDFDIYYFDTDSLYFSNESVIDRIQQYNKEVVEKINDVCNYYNLDFEDFEPKDIENQKHLIGEMVLDGEYSQGIFLGAKRYCLRKLKTGELKQTVSGIRKGGVDILENDITKFVDGLVYPYEQANKNISYYEDDQKEYIWENNDDFEQGCDIWKSEQTHSIALIPTTFTLGLTQDYIDLIDYINKKDLYESEV